MIRSLHIENYVLIDSLDIDFPESLIIITGQTGAGKSILLGALSLLTGAKSDPSVIGKKADNCVVEAEFILPDDPYLYAVLKDNEIDTDGASIIVRRVISSSGRTRSFVNDCPVNAGILPQISARLLDIHSQHNSLLLTNKSFQMSLLDNFAGTRDLVGNCAGAWKKCTSINKELETLRDRLRKSSLDSDYNSAILEKLQLANLKAGELETLEEEHKQLSNAEEIKSNLNEAVSLIESGDISLSGNLKEAIRLLERISSFVPGLESLSGRLEEARIELDDICSELADTAEKTVLSEERLEAVEGRMSELLSLLRKHGATKVEELIELRDSLAEQNSDSASLEYKIDELEKGLKKAVAEHLAICSELHTKRAAAAPELSKSIQDSLAFLELEHSVFSVSLTDSEPGESGSDEICFKFSASGANPVDVAKCASGGELSRIMLSLKQMLSRFTAMPTMIFDEIDTGVSGSVADKMGSMICNMGQNMQVIAITHLPQVAAKGNAHYVVSKTIEQDGTARSALEKVEGDKRVEEIARMLSGSSISTQALENAKVLLSGN